MRWWLIPIVLALGWFAYTLTPLWALYDLARAVQAGDTAYVENHVNFRTLRVSLTRQLAAAVKSGSSEFEQRERQRIVDAATALALPLAEALVTPQTTVDLLDDGWPQSLDLPNPPALLATGGLRVDKLGRLGAFYTASELRGFRTVVIAVPPDRTGPDQFKIRMRLRNWSWRLIEVELSETLRARIVARISRATKRGGEQGTEAPALRSGD
ncbi:DUF2939 domain-containing protein [Methylobacterium haplocladii]|uniref:DUF2939 domain-containing protein n=1 Tax=Methylobacterium haplocladii TaxID=1176176 RepID=A0A512IRE6_9HYPH|nr:DUF2939 domain-containing protein [Methylobacterium haplocladii]GEP00251.1 hypothetical protein MHA02_26380 [Methylobacterium haplocladii]GJD84241.1 hypothetical protein HPGCJGGD_2116 [Methylobacterium haplocladii]GLS60856.1 hypothetical protein GCM10007887_35450 [Methylobacterium haplocladii]